ncbi:MAG: hypothetical protein LBD71_06885 [Treponema sp.]|jgi:hypothetical protein|nr:hypothetical protein [Treponema sp.]
MRLPVFFFVLPFLFLACSRSDPGISYGFIELVYYQNDQGGRPLERYSFFIVPDHEDGVEDLAELFLYHDREGLRLKISGEDWILHEQEGKTWIGTRAIAMNENESLPRGMYRAELVSKGGGRSEKTFTFDAPEESPFPFPFFTVNAGEYHIESQYPQNRLILYDGEGSYVSTLPLAGLDGSLSSLNIPGNARTASLWAEDPEYRTSAYTNAVSLR